MPKVRKGALIVATNKVLSKYSMDDPVMDPLEAIVNAGRMAELLSSTRALGRIDAKKFEAYRRLSRLRPLEARELLKKAKQLEYVTIEWSKDDPPSVLSFEPNYTSSEHVFAVAADLYEFMKPSSESMALLAIVEDTLIIPQPLASIKSRLTGIGIPEESFNHAIRIAEELKLVSITQETEGGTPIVFNPFSFEKDANDAYALLSSLPETIGAEAIRIVDFVRDNPGIPFRRGQFDVDTLRLLINSGIIDYSKITTASRDEKSFPTTPHVWGTLQSLYGIDVSTDIIDDAKLLLNSFRYGQFFSPSSRGKIISPEWIVGALLRDRSIGVVKPASAIGTDYPLALSRGIVNIVESRIYPGRFSMELLKYDVAEAVRDVLTHKGMLPEFKQPTDQDLERAGRFMSPASVRVETELPKGLQELHEELVFGLRTMRKRK